jgi:hypothetical protein
MRNTFIFDIDGTVANGDHRRHFIQGPKGTKNWHAYRKLAHLDTPIDPVRRMFTMVRSSGHTDAIFVSGRGEEETSARRIAGRTEKVISDNILNIARNSYAAPVGGDVVFVNENNFNEKVEEVAEWLMK